MINRMNPLFNALGLNKAAQQRLDNELRAAAHQGQSGTIRRLVRNGANPDARTGPLERTVLMQVCERGNTAMARALLKAGAHADLQDNDNNAPMHLAAQVGSPGLIALLHKSGAATHVVNKQFKTPLMIAAELGETESVRKLLALGADPLFAAPKGMTALHLATISSSNDVITLLLKHGADPMAKTQTGVSALNVAHKIGNPAVLAAYQAHFSLKNSNKIHRLRKRKSRPKISKPA